MWLFHFYSSLFHRNVFFRVSFSSLSIYGVSLSKTFTRWKLILTVASLYMLIRVSTNSFSTAWLGKASSTGLGCMKSKGFSKSIIIAIASFISYSLVRLNNWLSVCGLLYWINNWSLLLVLLHQMFFAAYCSWFLYISCIQLGVDFFFWISYTCVSCEYYSNYVVCVLNLCILLTCLYFMFFFLHISLILLFFRLSLLLCIFHIFTPNSSSSARTAGISLSLSISLLLLLWIWGFLWLLWNLVSIFYYSISIRGSGNILHHRDNWHFTYDERSFLFLQTLSIFNYCL